MAWSWIGVDEAGYGARLGPLVVSASWWQLSEPEWTSTPSDADFLQRIDRWSWQAQFAASPKGTAAILPPHAVADSKKVYHSGQGLEKLERIVTSLLDAIERDSNARPLTSRPTGPERSQSPLGSTIPGDTDAGETDAGETDGSERDWAWAEASARYLAHAVRVQGKAPTTSPYWATAPSEPTNRPSSAEPPESRQMRLAESWDSPTVRPRGLFSALISEQEFNAGLLQHGNKANLLSATSLLLASQVLQQCPADQTIVIDFDRHGGRKRYLSMLVEHLGADWPQVLQETELESSYLWLHNGRRIFLRFTVDGERRYPVAAASLASKYARELGMNCVNAFWQRLLVDLKPSAGYPVDAVRFVAALEQHLTALPMSRECLWRNA